MFNGAIGRGMVPAFALALFASQAMAGPYYVRSIATVQTSGNIFDGHFSTQDTGQVQTTSNSAGPFLISSGSPFYSFTSSSDVFTEIGAVHGSVDVHASSQGPAGGGNASAQGQWSDTITITSNTLPNGTLVSFLATVVLHRTITGTVTPAGAHASASVTGPFGLNLTDTLSSPNPSQSVSTIVQTTVGSTLSATSTLTLSADASGIAPFNLFATVMAENTATFQFQPITPGASYTTASGVTFVPEPSSFVLAALGLIGLVVWRRRKR